MSETADKGYARLSDKVLEALKLAAAQKDLAIADLLVRTLDLAMTRGAGGADFVERREFSAEVRAALDAVDALRRDVKGL